MLKGLPRHCEWNTRGCNITECLEYPKVEYSKVYLVFPWSATVKWPARHPSPPQTQTMQLAYSTCSLSVALATFFSFLFLFLPLHLALLSSSHYGFSCSSPTSCAYTLYIVLFCFFFFNFLSSHAPLSFQCVLSALFRCPYFSLFARLLLLRCGMCEKFENFAGVHNANSR